MKEQLMKELKQAMKDKDVLKKGLLQLLIAGIKNEEIKEKRELTKDEQLTVIKRELKQTKDSLAQAESAEREDIAQEQRKKIIMLESFLPKFLNEPEILAVLESKGAKKGMNKGQLIGMVMKEHKSEVDGSLVNKVVTENFM